MDEWSEATLNFPVTTGDRLYVDRGARAELEFGPYSVRLTNVADLTVSNLDDHVVQLALERGTLSLSAFQLTSGDTVEVDTPNGSLTVARSGVFRVDIDPDSNRTRVIVNSGSLEITDGDFSQTVDAGQAVELSGQNPVEVESIPMPSADSFDEWCEARDLHLQQSTSAKYVSPATPGFDDLDDYGHWDVVADYGPIWYPPVAVGWVPYRFGHWSWIDPWGWTWIEDEPWGFCQFHYGRWVRIGVTWGWLPGPIVVAPFYAPALVAFLGGPGFSIGVSAGLVGWFPLGPGEPFFPWYHHEETYLREVNITNIRNVTNITNIANITNTNNVHYAYKTVATTAVDSKSFSSGQPVAQRVVPVKPEQLARAQIVPHPASNPTRQAAMPGKAVPHPPVSPHPVAAARAQQPPLAAAGGNGAPIPKESSAGRGVREPGPPASHARPEAPTPPRVIMRNTPPLPRLPFTDMRSAMREHPGRPLEPSQLDDLRAWRPVRPMKDAEFPPHSAPVARERQTPPPRPPKFH
jgi:hypothetical protein